MLIFSPLDGFARDDVLVAVIDGAFLPRKEGHFVKQAGYPIHLDKVLDVLLCAQSLERYLELFESNSAFSDPVVSVAPAAQTTA